MPIFTLLKKNQQKKGSSFSPKPPPKIAIPNNTRARDAAPGEGRSLLYTHISIVRTFAPESTERRLCQRGAAPPSGRSGFPLVKALSLQAPSLEGAPLPKQKETNSANP